VCVILHVVCCRSEESKEIEWIKRKVLTLSHYLILSVIKEEGNEENYAWKGFRIFFS